MKRLYIERFYLNRADNEYPMTVRVTLRLKDKVDEQILADALKATQLRYPYLCVKLGVVCDEEGIEHFVYDDNPLATVPTVCCAHSSTSIAKDVMTVI